VTPIALKADREPVEDVDHRVSLGDTPPHQQSFKVIQSV
jgi:hypothetical protein